MYMVFIAQAIDLKILQDSVKRFMKQFNDFKTFHNLEIIKLSSYV